MKLKTAVILAAGRGKRMNPLTKTIPKPMLHIAGCPLLERVIIMLREARIRHIILVVGYLHEQIMSYFKNGAKWGVNIQYSVQRNQLGMADALYTAKALLEKESHYLVCAADILVSPAFIRYLIRTHETRSATITLALQKIKLGKTIDTALVRLEKDGSVSYIVEKPPHELAPSNIACLPLYIFSNDIWEQVEHVTKSSRGEYELQDAIQATINLGKLVYRCFIDSRITISNLKDYLTVNWLFLKEIEHPIRGTVASGGRVILPSLVCQGSIIESDCLVGPYSYLETGVKLRAGVQVRNTIILAGSTVERNVKLYNTVVLPKTVVPMDTQLGKQGKDAIFCFPDLKDE